MKNIFKQRKKELDTLGFGNYESYLSSALWRAIRQSVYKTRGKQCCCCESKAQAVHHQQYDRQTLRGESIAHLYPICNACHELTHQPGWMNVFIARLRDDFDRDTLGFTPVVLDDYIHLKRKKPRKKRKKVDRVAALEKIVKAQSELIEQLQVDMEEMAERILQ